jgi:hypothetical protein
VLPGLLGRVVQDGLVMLCVCVYVACVCVCVCVCVCARMRVAMRARGRAQLLGAVQTCMAVATPAVH